MFDAVEVRNLKQACVEKLRGAILAGNFATGERLPSERDLASRLGVSRPVVHEAMVDLARAGLVQIKPRSGNYVRDYRRDGSIGLLNSLLEWNEWEMSLEMLEAVLAVWVVLEGECARLAVQFCSAAGLTYLKRLVEGGPGLVSEGTAALVEYDFCFLQGVAQASGNFVFPIVLNSFRETHMFMASKFFRAFAGSTAVEEVFRFHRGIVLAIEFGNTERARDLIVETLRERARYLRELDAENYN